MFRCFWREGLLLKMWDRRFARLGRLRWMFVQAFGRMGNWIGRSWLDFSPQCGMWAKLPRESKPHLFDKIRADSKHRKRRDVQDGARAVLLHPLASLGVPP